jgi:hypothetical protein
MTTLSSTDLIIRSILSRIRTKSPRSKKETLSQRIPKGPKNLNRDSPTVSPQKSKDYRSKSQRKCLRKMILKVMMRAQINIIIHKRSP